MTKLIKIALLSLLIPILIFGLGSVFIQWDILIDVYKFALTSLKVFDWIIPAQSVIIIFTGVLTIEIYLMLFKVSRWIISLFNE